MSEVSKVSEYIIRIAVCPTDKTRTQDYAFKKLELIYAAHPLVSLSIKAVRIKIETLSYNQSWAIEFLWGYYIRKGEVSFLKRDREDFSYYKWIKLIETKLWNLYSIVWLRVFLCEPSLCCRAMSITLGCFSILNVVIFQYVWSVFSQSFPIFSCNQSKQYKG